VQAVQPHGIGNQGGALIVLADQMLSVVGKVEQEQGIMSGQRLGYLSSTQGRHSVVQYRYTVTQHSGLAGAAARRLVSTARAASSQPCRHSDALEAGGCLR